MSVTISLPDAQSIPLLLFLAGAWFLIFALSRVHAHQDDYLEDPVVYHVKLPEAFGYGGSLNFDGDDEAVSREDGDSKLNDDIARIYPSCPADGQSLGPPIATSSAADIDSAIAKAGKAQIEWCKSSFAQRRRLLKTLLRYVLRHQNHIVRACCLDSGKTTVDATFGEILVTAEKLRWTIKNGQGALKPSRRSTNLLMCYKKNTVIYEPLGVVAACVSWNYPFHNFISPIISAVFAGNGIVVKPSEQTALSSLYFLDIVRGALSACGHDPDLVQSVLCWPDMADYLASHAGLSHITFIGSRSVARKVSASAARALTPLTLELGGKDPAIVLDDAATIRDLERVSDILMRGVFQSAGQNCIGIERVIAMPEVYDRLSEIILRKIKTLMVGHPLEDVDHEAEGSCWSITPTIDMGSMISSASFPSLTMLINSAISDGAILHTGGSPLCHPDHPQGSYFQPTMLSNVTTEMSIAQEEVFAPIFLLMRAPSVTAAIDMANSTSYNLGASVFGHDRRAVDECVRRVNAGMVSVNDFAAYYAVSLPFGGSGKRNHNNNNNNNDDGNKLLNPSTNSEPNPGSGSDSGQGSGHGRLNGPEGLRTLSNAKSICEETTLARLLGIRTAIPPRMRYPLMNGCQARATCVDIVGLGYGPGVLDRVCAAVGLMVGFVRGRGKRRPGGGGSRRRRREEKWDELYE